MNHHTIGHDHRPVPELPFGSNAARKLIVRVCWERRSPTLLARLCIQSRDLIAVNQSDRCAIGCQIRRGTQPRLAHTSVHRSPLQIVGRAPLIGIGGTPPCLTTLKIDGHHPQTSLLVHRQVEHTVLHQQLTGVFRRIEGAQQLARPRVQFRNRCSVPQCHIDLVAHRHQPFADVKGIVARSGGEPTVLPFAPSPSPNRYFPKWHTIECVACHQKPFVGQRMVPGDADRGFVNNIKQAPCGRYHRTDA